MGGCLSVKFEKKNEARPFAPIIELDDELIQRAKRYLKDQLQSSSYTQTGPSLAKLQKNTLKLGLGVDRIQSAEAAARETTEASLASEDFNDEETLNKNEEKSIRDFSIRRMR